MLFRKSSSRSGRPGKNQAKQPTNSSVTSQPAQARFTGDIRRKLYLPFLLGEATTHSAQQVIDKAGYSPLAEVVGLCVKRQGVELTLNLYPDRQACTLVSENEVSELLAAIKHAFQECRKEILQPAACTQAQQPAPQADQSVLFHLDFFGRIRYSVAEIEVMLYQRNLSFIQVAELRHLEGHTIVAIDLTSYSQYNRFFTDYVLRRIVLQLRELLKSPRVELFKVSAGKDDLYCFSCNGEGEGYQFIPFLCLT